MAFDQSLRDALERLAEKWSDMDTPALCQPANQQWAEGVDSGYDIAASELRELLAAHPAEPVGVSDEERASGLIDCGGTGHEFEAEVADCRTCGSVGVSDEAVEAAFYALHEEFAVTSPPILRKAVRSVLEAAAPLMGATPVASLAAVTAVLTAHNIECTGPGEVTCRGCREKGWMSWPDYRRHITDALLAAGVFRELDREALIQVIAEYIDDLDNVPAMGTSADHLERRAVHVTDAVLNLLGGAK